MAKEPSNTVSNIPPEIWQVIFSHLSARNNYECQRVCKSWYLPARRAFLDHVVLKSRYDLEEFLRCFTDDNTFSESVKKFTIGYAYTMPSRAGLLLQSEAIHTLIDRFPKVQELTVSVNCIDLENFTQPHIMSAILQKWTSLSVFRVNQILLSTEKIRIYLQTMYHLRQRMTELALYDHDYVTKEMGGASQFVSMFPQLRHLKIIPQQGNIDSFSDCLPILEHCGQHLESLDLHSKKEDEDQGLLMRDRSAEEKQKLARIKMLKLTMTSFCTNTVHFIIQNLVGLEKMTVGFVYANLSDWTENQKTVFTSDFLSYLCTRHEYFLRPLTINYKEDDAYLVHILSRHTTANSTEKVDLHTRLVLYNNNTQFGYDYNNAIANSSKFSLQLLSSKLQYGKLQRTSYFTHFYTGNNARDILDTFKVATSIKQATSLTLDLGGMCIFLDSIPRLVYQFLKMVPHVSQLSIVWPRSYSENNSFVWPEDTVQYPHVISLELAAGLASWVDISMLPLVSSMFPALSYLSMQLFSGYWHEASQAFVINLPQSKLTRLHLDVTPVRIQSGNVLKEQITFAEAFFVLKVTQLLDNTTTNESCYRVSLNYLEVTCIGRLEEQAQMGEHLTVHIIIKDIQYLNLYLSQEIYEQQQEKPILLSMDPQKKVQTSISFL
ncbi:uncharacterized protein ATC70_010207 [Mucor velutinosus]|uniref:F-box domain-containing protein n=1 Tax=Mucor velutinosus TaxID=708070 RepID=A0AAN7DMQ4_9FUNG|nr:hypothetical protein ATC70_010207 [Mucor velutinosus]